MGIHDDTTKVVQRYAGPGNEARPIRETFSVDPATISESHEGRTKIRRGVRYIRQSEIREVDLDAIYDREENLPPGPWGVREDDDWNVTLSSSGQMMCKITGERKYFAFDLATYLNNARDIIPKLCEELKRQIRVNKLLNERLNTKEKRRAKKGVTDDQTNS